MVIIGTFGEVVEGGGCGSGGAGLATFDNFVNVRDGRGGVDVDYDAFAGGVEGLVDGGLGGLDSGGYHGYNALCREDLGVGDRIMK